MAKRRKNRPNKAAIAGLCVVGLYALGSAVGDSEVPASAATKVQLSALGKDCVEPARALARHGFKGEDLVQGIASAAAESGCDNAAVNYNTNGTHDDCFMQVNSVHRAKALDSLDGCAKAAKKVKDSQGWGAWSSHNNGSDRKFIPIARQVAEVVR